MYQRVYSIHSRFSKPRPSFTTERQLGKTETIRILYADLLAHPAVQAWSQLQPVRVEPDRIEILKGKRPNRVEPLKTYACRLVGVGPAGSTVVAKRCWHSTALIERAVYEDILPRLPISSPHYYGVVEEANAQFCWLFLEDAGDDARSSFPANQLALSTEWLSLMHTSATDLPVPACLPDKGPNHYLKLLRSVRVAMLEKLAEIELPADQLAPLRGIASRCDALEARWDQLEASCEGIPQTLVHGDFVAKNFRVGNGEAGVALLPFDWGEAGWGVPAVDLIRVDIALYSSLVGRHWPWLNLGAIQRLASAGKIFRALDAMIWELPRSRNAWRIYESWLTAVIREAGLKE